jgi:hypothetical protein
MPPVKLLLGHQVDPGLWNRPCPQSKRTAEVHDANARGGACRRISHHQGMQGAYNKNWQRNTGIALVAGGLALAWVFNLSRRLEQRCLPHVCRAVLQSCDILPAAHTRCTTQKCPARVGSGLDTLPRVRARELDSRFWYLDGFRSVTTKGEARRSNHEIGIDMRSEACS